MHCGSLGILIFLEWGLFGRMWSSQTLTWEKQLLISFDTKKYFVFSSIWVVLLVFLSMWCSIPNPFTSYSYTSFVACFPCQEKCRRLFTHRGHLCSGDGPVWKRGIEGSQTWNRTLAMEPMLRCPRISHIKSFGGIDGFNSILVWKRFVKCSSI